MMMERRRRKRKKNERIKKRSATSQTLWFSRLHCDDVVARCLGNAQHLTTQTFISYVLLGVYTCRRSCGLCSAQQFRWDSPVRSNLIFYLSKKELGHVFYSLSIINIQHFYRQLLADNIMQVDSNDSIYFHANKRGTHYDAIDDFSLPSCRFIFCRRRFIPILPVTLKNPTPACEQYTTAEDQSTTKKRRSATLIFLFFFFYVGAVGWQRALASSPYSNGAPSPPSGRSVSSVPNFPIFQQLVPVGHQEKLCLICVSRSILIINSRCFRPPFLITTTTNHFHEEISFISL